MALTLGFLLKAETGDSQETIEGLKLAVEKATKAMQVAAEKSSLAAKEATEKNTVEAKEFAEKAALAAEAAHAKAQKAIQALAKQTERVEEEELEKFRAKAEIVSLGVERNFTGAFRKIEGSLSSAALKFAGIAAVGATVGGVLFEMANQAAEAGDKIYIASKATGLSVEMLGGLQIAAKKADLDFGQVTKSMVHFALETSNLTLAASPASKALEMLGIQGDDLAKFKLKSMDDKFIEVIERLKGVKDGGEKAAIASTLLGGRTERLIAALDGGSESIKENNEQASKLYGWTEKNVEKDHEWVEEVLHLKEVWGGFSHEVGEVLIPVITWLIEEIEKQALAWKGLWIELEKVGLYQEKFIAYSQLDFKAAAEVQKQIDDLNRSLDENLKAYHSIGQAKQGDKEKTDAEVKSLKDEAKETDGSTGKLKTHAGAMKQDADATQQATEMGKGYTEQLQLMTKVVDESNRAMEKRLALLHEQLQAVKDNAKPTSEPGGAIDPSGLGAGNPEQTVSQPFDLAAKGATKTQQAITGLSQAIEQMSGKFGKAGPAMQKFGEALQKVAQAQKEGKSIAEAFGAAQKKQGDNAVASGVSTAAAFGEEAASFIKNKRAQAIVMAVMETAKGLAMLAIQNYEGAALDFASAAMYGVIAGTAGGGGGGKNPANVGGGASPGGGGGGGGQQSVGGGSMLGGGSGGGGYHQTQVNIYGGGITDTNNLQNLATSLNQGAGSGTIRLNVSGTSATIPTPAY
jgi:hypothetical protein